MAGQISGQILSNVGQAANVGVIGTGPAYAGPEVNAPRKAHSNVAGPAGPGLSRPLKLVS
jgi:hypothetical protein